MSLILQALKKAEAERSLGRVPTLDQVTAAEPLPAPSAHRARWAGAIGVIAVAAAVAAWWWHGSASVEPVVAAAAALPASAAASAATASATRSDPQAAVAPQAPVVLPPAPAAAPRASAAASATLAGKAITAPPRTAPPARPASAAEAPMPALHDLPVAVRQALPPLPLGGSIWSPNPAERMLILAGEVRREGDAITPELVLVSIGPRSAVLRWREQSFRLPY